MTDNKLDFNLDFLENKSVPEKNNNVKKKSNNIFSWLLWWQVDDFEIKRQVEKYNELKITESARGVSFLCLLFSIIVSIIFALTTTSGLWLDIILMIVIAIFVYKGSKIALIGAMIYWTIAKLVQLSGQGSTGSSTPIIAIIWWATYMHAFYTAFKVESLRKSVAK